MNRICLAIAMPILGTAGCISLAFNPPAVLLQAQLDANRAKWAAQGIESYEYEFQNACFCAPDVTRPTIITVENGQVTALRLAGDGSPIEPQEGGVYPTIEELFDTVQAGLDGADSVDVEYDEQRGYPTNIHVDWLSGAADEETAHFASNLVIP